jgi:hypothetical protein
MDENEACLKPSRHPSSDVHRFPRRCGKICSANYRLPGGSFFSAHLFVFVEVIRLRQGVIDTFKQPSRREPKTSYAMIRPSRRSIAWPQRPLIYSGVRTSTCIRLGVRPRRSLVYMDHERNWITARKFPHPIHDKFFRVMIQIPLLKRRRIHRVE